MGSNAIFYGMFHGTHTTDISRNEPTQCMRCASFLAGFRLLMSLMRCVNLAYVQRFSDMKMHQTHAQINTEPFFMSWKPSPLRLYKNSLCCFCAIRTQRHNPTFFGSKICLPMYEISLLPIFLGMYFYRHPKLQFQERGKSVASRAC